MSMDETWKDAYIVRREHRKTMLWPGVTGAMHYVESIIADRAVTYCGRQMPEKTQSGTLEKVGGGYPMCSVCAGRKR